MARRGPTLGVKLLLASLLLLALPWLAWRGLAALEGFLVDGQLRALELVASGSVALLQGETGRLVAADTAGTTAAYAWPLTPGHRLDGYPGDWAQHPDPGHAAGGAGSGAPELRLRLGTSGAWLVALAEVRDPRLTYRQPGLDRLDRSDQLRVELHGDDGATRYLLVAPDGPGRLAVQSTTAGWAYPDGEPDPAITAVWQPAAGGYTVELRLPLALLAAYPVLRVAALDVDPATRRPRATVVTAPLRPRYREPRIESLLGGLADGPARVWVVDRDGWVRASVGAPSALAPGGAGLIAQFDPARVAAWRSGDPGTAAAGADGDLLLRALPLPGTDGEPVATVVVEQGRDALLRARYRAFAEFALGSLALLAVTLAALLLFAARLAWRIRRLGREAGAAIDVRGRQVAERLAADAASGDELGELSRTISALLARLRRHTRFLEGLPRTLRHELSNPLNTAATALENLAEAPDAAARTTYLARARRGLARLERTLHALTEAAYLEEALQGDPHVRLDLRALVSAYLESFAMQHPGLRLVARLGDGPLWVDGTDHRLEQLLDKLLDNAADFTPAGGEVEVTLAPDGDSVRLAIANDGPVLPQALRGRLFEAPVSVRPGDGGVDGHLGLGLYVARRIAEAHGGTLDAGDRPGGTGAVFTLRVPRTA